MLTKRSKTCLDTVGITLKTVDKNTGVETQQLGNLAKTFAKKLSVLFICGWYPSRVSPYNGDFIERHAKAVSKKHFVNIIHIISDKNQKTYQNIKNNIITI